MPLWIDMAVATGMYAVVACVFLLCIHVCCDGERPLPKPGDLYKQYGPIENWPPGTLSRIKEAGLYHKYDVFKKEDSAI